MNGGLTSEVVRNICVRFVDRFYLLCYRDEFIDCYYYCYGNKKMEKYESELNTCVINVINKTIYIYISIVL